MDLKAFLKGNKKSSDTIKAVISAGFVDEKGNGIEWEIKAITSTEDEEIRKECTKRVAIAGKKGMFTSELDSNKYMGLLAAECVIFPDLKDKSLQDSYGVYGADELLKEMLNPGEYADLLTKIQELNGFDVTLSEKVDAVKN